MNMSMILRGWMNDLCVGWMVFMGLEEVTALHLYFLMGCSWEV